MSKMLGCSGTSTLSASASTSLSRCRAGRPACRARHAWCRAAAARRCRRSEASQVLIGRAPAAGAGRARAATTAGGRRRPASPHGRGSRSSPQCWLRAWTCRRRPWDWRPGPPAWQAPRRLKTGAMVAALGVRYVRAHDDDNQAREPAAPHLRARRPPALARFARQPPPAEAAAQAVPGVDVNDLYAQLPRLRRSTSRPSRPGWPRADLLVLLHPIQWYSMPALQKLWLDDVLTLRLGLRHRRHALQGKDCWLVATTGGPETSYHPQSYNRYFFDAFLPPYEQTAALCGMRFLPPLLLHGARSAPRGGRDGARRSLPRAPASLPGLARTGRPGRPARACDGARPPTGPARPREEA